MFDNKYKQGGNFMKEETVYANCSICGNKSGYDRKSLKASTIEINGIPVVLCCQCDDELLKKLAKGRGIKITLGDGGEVLRTELPPGMFRLKPKARKEIIELVDKHLMSDDAERILDLIDGYD